MATTQELFDKVNDAINTRLSGGVVLSYNVGGVNLQYDSIDKLMALRREFKREIDAGKGARTYVSFANP